MDYLLISDYKLLILSLHKKNDFFYLHTNSPNDDRAFKKNYYKKSLKGCQQCGERLQILYFSGGTSS